GSYILPFTHLPYHQLNFDIICMELIERKANCSPRQFRHLDYISQFTTDIRHIKGKDNIVADPLSRMDELQMPVDLDILASSQASDDELAQLLGEESSLRLKKLRIPDSQTELYCDISTSTPRPFVTKPLRRQLFNNGSVSFIHCVCRRQHSPAVASRDSPMGSTTTLLVGRLSTRPLAVVTSRTRTSPSLPGCTAVTRPRGHVLRGRFGSQIITKSPTLGLSPLA
ncbi:hypothetical protein K1T71_014432, partial [Dendrolimus kikuchii]